MRLARGDYSITGEPLAELVRQFNLANAIMMRLTRVIAAN